MTTFVHGKRTIDQEVVDFLLARGIEVDTFEVEPNDDDASSEMWTLTITRVSHPPPDVRIKE